MYTNVCGLIKSKTHALKSFILFHDILFAMTYDCRGSLTDARTGTLEKPVGGVLRLQR